MTRRIKLIGKFGEGKYALVSDEDFEFINSYKWALTNDGYVRRCPTPIGTKRVWMHRVVNKTPEGLLTDHINGYKLDNRRDNLRSCTKAENNKNRALSSNNTTGYNGVSLKKDYKKWIASIRHEGKTLYLGAYKTAEEAAEVYRKHEVKLRGSFARSEERL